MGGVFVDEGLQGTWTAWLASTVLTPGIVGLFDNDPGTITVATVIADLTEATFDGYSAVALSSPVVLPPSSDIVAAKFPACTFTAGASISTVDIYGYYVRANYGGGDVLLWAEKFVAPITLSIVGQSIIVIPIATLRDVSTP